MTSYCFIHDYICSRSVGRNDIVENSDYHNSIFSEQMSQPRSRTGNGRRGGIIAIIEAICRRLAKIIMLASNDPDEKTSLTRG